MPDTDSRLLFEARRGNEASFLALYERHRTPLFRFAWRLTGSVTVAEDTVQECFLALLDGNGFRERAGSLRQYLFGITRNVAFRQLRSLGREDELDDVPASKGPFDELLSVERSEAVGRAIAALPALQREAIILFEYEELSLEEIASIAQVEVGAVKARLHRARETLRSRLAPLLADAGQRRCS